MEDSPALVLVPPTPLKFDSPSTSTQRSSSFPTQSQRPTSETTIFSIYSMYGDDHARSSWSASPPVTDRKSSDGSLVPTVKLKLPDARRTSTLRSSGHTSELAYLDADILRKTPEIDLSTPPMPRPASSYHPTSSLRASGSEDRRTSSQSFRTSVTSTSVSRSRPSSRHTSNHSRQSSGSSLRHERTTTAESSIPPLPPLPSSRSPSLRPTSSVTPPRQPSPTLQPPTTPQRLPLKHPVFTDSPSSKISLVPSEGEDPDAFHVRNTYAQLEMSGVKGDGYEEGVERTRARIGASRSSQLNAQAALGDGNEKSRELDPKEIQTLASLDR